MDHLILPLPPLRGTGRAPSPTEPDGPGHQRFWRTPANRKCLIPLLRGLPILHLSIVHNSALPESPVSVIRKSGQALDKSKATGRNKVVLSFEEKMAPNTSHYPLTQLERLSALSAEQGVGEAVLLREAPDDLLTKYRPDFAS
jgi:hypothetical protein